MGHWGVKSHEIDEAADALDAALEKIHGQVYIDLMEDDNPLTVDQIQKKLLNAATLPVALEALVEQSGLAEEDYGDTERLAYAGIVVRHAEFGVPIPDEIRSKAIARLESEEIEWEEATKRKLRREKEIELLRGK